MLFYIGQICIAFVIALSLQVVKIKGISCAERMSDSIERTVLSDHLNDVANIVVFYLQKLIKQKHIVDVDTDSIKKYVPGNVQKSMLRVQKMEDDIFDKPSNKDSDVIYSEGYADQEVVFDGVKETELNKANQSPKRGISSISE